MKIFPLLINLFYMLLMEICALKSVD